MSETSSTAHDSSSSPVARLERAVGAGVLTIMVLLPVGAVLARWITGDASAGPNIWTQNLNLVLAFVGAVLAARTGRHLNLSTAEVLNVEGSRRKLMDAFTAAVATAVSAMLAVASWEFVQAEMQSVRIMPGGLPLWVIQMIMPLGFFGMAFYFATVQAKGWKARVGAVLAVGVALGLSFVPVGSRTPFVYAGGAVLFGAVGLGAPIFTIMGGMAMLLFYGQPMPTPISAVPLETFGLVASPTLPAIPLFTLAGYLLAEGGSSKRLVAVFRELFGWLPGGIAAATVLVCAFFTTFTGASGVTILALGGLLLPVLTKAGYSEKFSIGLLIASGSIGLLFPPSLPVILYGVVAQVPIDKMFMAGVVPGILLVLTLVTMGVWHSVRNGATRSEFDAAAAVQALWLAKWEAALPVLVLVGIFGGFLTIFEAAAFTAFYAFLVEVVVHRDMSLREDIPRVLTETATLMGGVLIILGVALGLTNFLIDAEVPMRITAWAEQHIGSRIVFILLLNVFLLLVGCLMDIFSAIVVVVPLIVPIAVVFGVNPIHLGILFLANLELGYLTPPVGMNLFLASYRFNRPLTDVYRMGLPFLGALAVGVLVIAYVPALTLWPHDEGDLSTTIDFDSALGEPSDPTPALPLGDLDLNAMLDEDTPTPDPSKPLGELDLNALLSEPAQATPDPSKPLGELDLNALLSEPGDDDSAEQAP